MKWLGKCPDCGEWNTLQEQVVRAAEKPRSATGGGLAGGSRPVALTAIPADGSPRLVLANSELNRVLGGGIVPGAGVLVGGDPGIGKSTLLLQMAAEVAATAGPVLYASAEESDHQIGRRAHRLGLADDRLFVFSEIVVEQIIEQIEQMKPVLVIVDSIQAIYSEGGGARRARLAKCVTARRCCCALPNSRTCRSSWWGT